MAKIRAKVWVFNYWISMSKGSFKFEGLRDNGMDVSLSDAPNIIARIRKEKPNWEYKIEAS